MTDLWTVRNPPAWMTLLPNVVASDPESVTLSLAIDPARTVVGYERVLSLEMAEKLLTVVDWFWVDHKKHLLMPVEIP